MARSPHTTLPAAEEHEPPDYGWHPDGHLRAPSQAGASQVGSALGDSTLLREESSKHAGSVHHKLQRAVLGDLLMKGS